jgi:SAM-dependent methyltransferase
MTFADHFSTQAADYARFRPRYPASLYDAIAAAAPGRALALDVGTGNGQAAVALAERFDRVVATDPSDAQIASAEPHARAEYRVAAAEDEVVEDGTVDVLTVAQALHWFDHPRFFATARRALRPGGVLVAWSYAFARCTPEVDAALYAFHDAHIEAYWPPDRAIVMRGYRDIELPFAPVDLGSFEMEADLSLDAYLGYLGTWSAVARYRKDRGEDPLPAWRAAVLPAWGDPQTARRVAWPLVVIAGRNNGEATA